MDHNWIRMYGSNTKMPVQISFASEGDSEEAVPNLSIEVDDIEKGLKKQKEHYSN